MVSGDSPSNGAALAAAGAVLASVLAAESALASEPACVEGGAAGAVLSAVLPGCAVSREASLDSVAPPDSAYNGEDARVQAGNTGGQRRNTSVRVRRKLHALSTVSLLLLMVSMQ
jgi:hypothetical protein